MAVQAKLERGVAPTHRLPVRVSHWVNTAAVLVMIGSGWGIYNTSPLFAFTFPRHLTLGGWLGGSLAWHFAAMWLLAGNLLLYASVGLLTGHFRRRLRPPRPADILRDLRLAATARLPHAPGQYNAVQRLLYVLVLLATAGAIVSGLAIWKPVQLAPLCNLLGGYEAARREHFLMMAGIVVFIAVHVAMVIKHPRTVRPMVLG